MNTTSDVNQATIQESDIDDEAKGGDEDEGEEDNSVSPDIPPTG